MVLSNSQTFSSEARFHFSPPIREPRHKPYAQAVTTATKVSLMHDHIMPPHNDESSRFNTLQTSIFRTSRTKGAFLFNISPCKGKYNDQQNMVLLKEQHPNVHACVPLSDGPRRYLEVYIMPQKDYNNIAQTGPTFPDVNLVVYPCAALGESANVVNLKLTHLPMLPAEEVKKGLAKSWLSLVILWM